MSCMANTSRCIAFCCFLFAFTVIAAKADDIKNVADVKTISDVEIISIELGEGIQTADGHGFYAEILSLLLAAPALPAQRTILPLKRSLLTFSKATAPCIWPIDKKLLGDLLGAGEELVGSEVLFNSTQRIFTANGQPAISAFDDLSGRSVGISIGSNLDGALNDISAQVSRVPTQDVKLNMLVSKRLFAIVGWLPDLLIAVNNQQLPPPAFDRSLVLSSSGIGLVCHRTPATLAFLESFNRRIRDLKTSARIKTLAVKYGVSNLFE